MVRKSLAAGSRRARAHSGHAQAVIAALALGSLVTVLVAGVVGFLTSTFVAPRIGTLVPTSRASAGAVNDLWFSVQSAVWASHDSAAGEATSVARRLHIEIKVQNRGNVTRMVGPQDFRLRGVNGTESSASGRTFPLTPLAPTEYLHGVLTFDVAAQDSPFDLIWTRLGHEVRLAVAVAAFAPARLTRRPNLSQ